MYYITALVIFTPLLKAHCLAEYQVFPSPNTIHAAHHIIIDLGVSVTGIEKSCLLNDSGGYSIDHSPTWLRFSGGNAGSPS